ncbi:MAG TPA: hypothetical protein VEZ40_03005 [Pyrinomonadaceae bacterium]|nr:hypothetical protein [Pyrinomonadaceae bacterium]
MSHKQKSHLPRRHKENQGQADLDEQIAERQVEVDAVELKTIEIRLDGIRDATQRSRFIFLIMTIVASAILITLWNGLLSWSIVHANKLREAESLANTRVLRNQDELINEWIKNRTISIELLGIRVGGSDLAVIGSLGLIVIMAWYFFSQRRENRAIVSLLRDCTDGFKERRLTKDVCSMVYQGIVHNLVFIDIGKGDEAWSGLEHEHEKDKSVPELIIRKILRVLVYLPPFTILMIILSDIASLFLVSAFRTSTEPLWKILWNERRINQTARVVFFEVLAISATMYTLSICRKSRKFSNGTADTLKHFDEVITNSEEFLKDPDRFLKGLKKPREVTGVFQ